MTKKEQTTDIKDEKYFKNRKVIIIEVLTDNETLVRNRINISPLEEIGVLNLITNSLNK